MQYHILMKKMIKSLKENWTNITNGAKRDLSVDDLKTYKLTSAAIFNFLECFLI